MPIFQPVSPLPLTTASNIISSIPMGVDQRISITLALRRPDFQGITLKDYADGVISGKYPVLSRDDFTTNFAVADQDLQIITQFAQDNNLTVVDLHAPGAMVILSGTVESFNTIFKITINSVTTTDRTYRSYSGTLTIPDELNGIVLAFPGLDQSMSLKSHLSTQGPNNNPNFPINPLTPPQVAKAYNFPESGGFGECIAIAELGGGYSHDNLVSSFTDAGLPLPTIIDGGFPENLGGALNDPASKNANETMLDIFVAGGLAPKAKIIVYFGTDGKHYNLFNYIVHDSVNNPSVISFSYGGYEFIYDFYPFLSLERQQTESIFQAAASMGITICVSTGDYGTYAYPQDPENYQFTVNWPAISPYVLACGGTSLQLAPDGSIGFESVWNSPGAAYTSPQNGYTVSNGSGGGVSTSLVTDDPTINYGTPSWQTNLTIKTNPDEAVQPLPSRGIPDVAANADSATGYTFSFGPNNSTTIAGGTSAAAPLWAAAIATINSVNCKRAGFINPLLYSKPNVLNDITVGNNCIQINGLYTIGFEATAGWDACTGLGSPNVAAISELFAPPNPPLSRPVRDVVPFNSTNNNVPLNVEGNYIRVRVVTPPGNGVASVNGLEISYTPNDGFFGIDTFTYTADSVGGTSNVSLVTITVLFSLKCNPINETVLYNSSNNSITPIANNTFTNVNIVSGATNGIAVSSGTNIIYTPTRGYYGSDNFIYSITNNGIVSNTATVNITVAGPDISISPPDLGCPILINNQYGPITLSASGGNNPYQFSISSGSLPSGFTFSTDGILSGSTPNTGTYTFAVSVIDQSTPVPVVASQQYSLIVYPKIDGKLSWVTPPGFLSTITELTTSSICVVAAGDGISYSLISGQLPPELQLSPNRGRIYGIPAPVINFTTYEFVIRARDSHNQVRDRTFTIDVKGPNSPTWITAPGYLKVGVNGEYYAINNQYISYQLIADPTISPVNTPLMYYIADNDGRLPPGITLNQKGLLSGYLRDTLQPSASISNTGGYDSEAYDGYTYDHAVTFTNTTTAAIIGYPKIYNFIVTATDGIARSTQEFTIVVTDMNILEYAPNLMPSNLYLQTNGIYLQYPQWVSGNNLGTIRAGHKQDIEATVYDPAPLIGNITYEMSLYTDTSSIYDQLPNGLSLDPSSGHIYGFVPYQPFYSENYSFIIDAIKSDSISNQTVRVSNTFNLTVKGQTENDMVWVSGNDLGSISAGYVSELAIVAKHVNSNTEINYHLESGSLPPGLTLLQDGSISGRVDYTSTAETYSFTAMATDIYKLNQISKTFTISVNFLDNLQYQQVILKALLSNDARMYYNNFINNDYIFDPSLIYRYFDPNFGIQSSIQVTLDFGIEIVDTDLYIPALRENFYRQRLYFGDIKSAIATDNSGNVIYEAIYLDIVNGLTNSNGQSVSKVFYTKDGYNIYYPSSIQTMRNQIQHIVLPDNTYIKTDKYQNPKFMRTQQGGTYKAPEFIFAMILCYTLPGKSTKIINRIKNSGFDFKMIDFEIDRLILQSGTDESTAKYLVMPRSALGEQIPADDLIYGDINFVRIDVKNKVPLNRI